MTIEMNWGEVGQVAAEVRSSTELAVNRVNKALAAVGSAASANPGFATSAALATCRQKWATELGEIIHQTMIDSDKLDDSAYTMQQAEEENRRAAAALVGVM